MRHYVWYDTTETIRGTHTNTGGFPDDCDLADPNSKHPLVNNILRSYKLREDYGGCIAYECNCNSDKQDCQCVYLDQVNLYVKEGRLVEKPTLTVKLDGVAIVQGRPAKPTDRAPGVDAVMELSGNIPDGHEVLLRMSRDVHLIKEEINLTFRAGKTQMIALKAPAQGMLGWVHGQSKYVRPFGVYLRGWA